MESLGSFFTAVVLFSLLGYLYFNSKVDPMILILLGISALVNVYRGFKELKKKS
ncbi:hypothetical protein [Brevibacillus laterosporus]|uniref:hypothetical protein n=1 Tax=Brevibacillus laterosporus TaxID=1465 RepID=UPI0015E214F9|nr:hypothetical protein [Brevibacillus laterosporus]